MSETEIKIEQIKERIMRSARQRGEKMTPEKAEKIAKAWVK